MPGFRGRAILYPGLLIAGWAIGRSISYSAPLHETATENAKPFQGQLAFRHATAASVGCPTPLPLREMPVYRYQPLHRAVAHAAPAAVVSRSWPAPALTIPNAERDFEGGSGIFDILAFPDDRPAKSKSLPVSGGTSSPEQGRLQFYGYNFWRQGRAGSALAPNAQYGGSQYGAIAIWDPLGRAGTGPALLLRGAGTPAGSQREIAVGTRWQPDHKWPLSASIERRFRSHAPDSFAAYIAGGLDRMPVVGKLSLDAYGQVGYSLGGESSPFADAHARLQYPLAEPLGIPLRIGTGAWFGGQKATYRADIGPTLSAQIDTRLTDFTLQLDWRKRVAGNAVPQDGLALTVATDF